MSTTPATSVLSTLVGLRTAPSLEAGQRQRLREELAPRVAACEWFTVGVMAPGPAAALAALRGCEQAFGWEPLRASELRDPSEGEIPPVAGDTAADPADGGPVFLKGNQRTGTYHLRPEAGLGEGILITGHNPVDPAAENTWGPLPLDLFAS